MKSQITPGTWKWMDVNDAQNNPCGYSVWQDYERKHVNDKFGRKICQTPDGTTKENLANIKAISALPDLLEACQEISRAWESAPQEFFVMYGNQFDAAVGMSREAIKKATG